MSDQIRSYGGWRERRGFGVGTLTGRQTAAGLGLVLVCLVSVMVMPAALPALAVPAAVMAVLVVVRVHGESIAALMSRHSRWHWSQRRGTTQYSAVEALHLPGVLAGCQIITTESAAIVWDTRSATVTAVIPVEPSGASFADTDEVRSWVSGWGEWLTHLGYIDGLAHVVVSVHSSPTPANPGPSQAQGLVDRVMAELDTMASGMHRAQTVISVTMRVGDSAVQATTLRLLEVVAAMHTLDRCGVTVLQPWTVADLVRWVRSCFDPLTANEGDGQWLDARPTAAQEMWDAYRHDGGISAAFAWDEAPGDNVPASALTALLGPADYPKRISLVFHPVPAREAAKEVDRQAEAAAFRSQYRRRLGRDETARERLDVERARQTAHDQASGSGLVDVGLYAVATAPDIATLDTIAADLHHRAGESRIRLRRAYGTQAACFAATLGLGYVPARRW